MSVAVVQREYSDADFEQMIDAARPVVKWAGGKRQLEGVIVRKIRRMMGKEPIRVYQEPFLGGGAGGDPGLHGRIKGPETISTRDFCVVHREIGLFEMTV